MVKYITFFSVACRKRVWNVVVLNHIVKLNIVSALEVAKPVEINVVVENVRIKRPERSLSLTLILVANAVNLDVLKSTVNVFKMVKNVVHSVSVQIVATENELLVNWYELASRLFQ